MGRVGLEPIGVTPLTCSDAETADITARFCPAASCSIRLGQVVVQRSLHHVPLHHAESPCPPWHAQGTRAFDDSEPTWTPPGSHTLAARPTETSHVP